MSQLENKYVGILTDIYNKLGYKTLQKLNANINQNLEPEILCDEIYTNLNIKVILRLTSQLKIQQKLI